MSVIDVKMSAIYRAAHEELPERASDFASRAESITGAIEPIVNELSLAGNHPIGGDLADISVELFRHLSAMVGTFNDSAVALDRMADDFVRLDDEAETWFERHRKYLGAPPVAAKPTAPGV